VSKESCDDSSPSCDVGRPMPRGRDREKSWEGAEGAAWGKPKTDDRGGAIGVSLCVLEDAEEGVCA
jgi:hypothetical protein